MADASNELYSAVRAVIRRRKTVKVLGSIDQPLALDAENQRRCDAIVRECVADAGWAPFHFDRRVDNVAEPWRVHWLRQPACLQVARQLGKWFNDLKPGNKLPALLAACGCTVLVTWLPQVAGGAEEEQKIAGVNEEHLAATAAYVENLLLLLDAAGMGTYWSTGSLFKTEIGSQKLGIPAAERMIACVFVDYSPGDDLRAVELAPGGQREKRSPSTKWTREIDTL